MELEIIKQLREKTGAGILECQQALKEADNNIEKAVENLRKKGEKIMAKKQTRTVNEGIIESYIHNNRKIGVLLELVCETDFVARNGEFQELAHNLAMQIAATDPQWLKVEDVPEDIVNKEKEIARASLPQDKPEQVKEKILQGKLEKFYNQFCLLEQNFIKDETKKIIDIIQEKIAKLGENIQIKKFTRFQL